LHALSRHDKIELDASAPAVLQTTPGAGYKLVAESLPDPG
jgi:hypothetical protein